MKILQYIGIIATLSFVLWINVLGFLGFVTFVGDIITPHIGIIVTDDSYRRILKNLYVIIIVIFFFYGNYPFSISFFGKYRLYVLFFRIVVCVVSVIGFALAVYSDRRVSFIEVYAFFVFVLISATTVILSITSMAATLHNRSRDGDSA